jgi:hypothetical protein
VQICDLQTGTGIVHRATSRLKEAWAETTTHWRDERQREFARDRLDPLLPELSLLLATVQRFTELLGDAVRDCRDEEREQESSLG